MNDAAECLRRAELALRLATRVADLEVARELRSFADEQRRLAAEIHQREFMQLRRDAVAADRLADVVGEPDKGLLREQADQLRRRSSGD